MKYLAVVIFLTVATQQCPVSAFQPLPSLHLQRTQLSSKASPFVAPTNIGHALNWKVQLQSAVSNSVDKQEAIATLGEDSHYTAMLLDAIGYNATAATALLAHIQSGLDKEDAFLDALLANGPDASPMPFWTHSKWLARTSKRARWASLSRVLQQATRKDSTSRGQALVRVLEALQTIAGNQSNYGALPGIVALEKNSIKDPMSYMPPPTTGPLPGIDVDAMVSLKTNVPAVVEAVVNDQVDDKAEIPDSVALAEVATGTEGQVAKVRNMMRRLLRKPSTKDMDATRVTDDIVISTRDTKMTPKKTWRQRIVVVVPKPLRRLGTTQDAKVTTKASNEIVTTDFEIVAAPRDPSASKAVVNASKDEEISETQKLMTQVKEAGTAGVISYALWEFAFWAISVPVCIVGYQQVTGHWPDLTNADDQAKLGAEAFAFVNFARFAVPLRIGLALSTTPWIQENVVDRFFAGDKNEEAPLVVDTTTNAGINNTSTSGDWQ